MKNDVNFVKLHEKLLHSLCAMISCRDDFTFDWVFASRT